MFNGNVSAATLAFGGGTGTVQIGSGYNLTTTNITGAAAGTLTLVGGTQTVAGTINDASMIINAGATSAATTFSGNVTAATIHATGTGAGGTIALNGATTTANLLFDATSTDTVTVASGSTLAGNVNGTGGTLGAGIGTLKLAGTNTVTGQIGNTGYLNTLTLLGSGVTDTVTSAATAVNAATHTNLANNTLL